MPGVNLIDNMDHLMVNGIINLILLEKLNFEINIPIEIMIILERYLFHNFAAKALKRLHRHAVSSEPLLLTHAK